MTETNPIDPLEALAVWLRANGYAPLLDCAVADCDTKALYAAIERYGREGVAADAPITALRAELARPLEVDELLIAFASWAIREHRQDGGCDIEAGSVQDELERLGILENAPCGEHCTCDDFPGMCLALAPGIEARLAALTAAEAREIEGKE